MKTVVLQDQEWQQVVSMLAEFPFKQVNGLLQNMIQQLNAPPSAPAFRDKTEE